MAGETTLTVIGNLTSDPELRFTPSGAAVANFTIASTPRTFDRQSQEWKDGDTLFLRCSVWREPAENVAESLQMRQYETKEGEKRTSTELQVDEVGPSLRYAQASVRKTQRGGGGGAPQARQQADPWSTPAPVGGGYGQEEPPFAHATGCDLALQRGDAVVV
jgi:single-strand DNA-binding protein